MAIEAAEGTDEMLKRVAKIKLKIMVNQVF